MLKTRASLTAYSLPTDGVQAKKDVIRAITTAVRTVRVLDYEFTDKDISAALVAAQLRGVDTRLVLFLREALTPATLAVLHAMFLAGFPPANLRLTMSEHGNLMHRKDLSMDSGILISGSTNLTPGAYVLEDNVMYVFRSPQLALWMEHDFDALWLYASTHEPTQQLTA